MSGDLVESLLARLDKIDPLHGKLSDDLPHHPYCAGVYDACEFRPDLCDCGWPQRVLAWCAMMREVIELHRPKVRPVLKIGDRVVMSDPECPTCAVWDEADYDGPPPVVSPCRTLRTLDAALG